MINKITLLLKSKLVRNSFWLYLLQAFNTVIPLLTLPYVTRILGADSYGVFSFALNIITYFQVLVEYGFNLTGVKKVAYIRENGGNRKKLLNLYSTILCSKLILTSISIIVIGIISLFLIKSVQLIFSLWLLFTIVLGTALQQNWFFQGVQNVKYITIITMISRTITTILIFVFMKDKDQVALYSFLFGVSYLLSGIMSLHIIKKIIGKPFQIPSMTEIKQEIKDGWDVFTTNAFSKIFGGIGITFLGLFHTSYDVGVFSAIQKISSMLILIYQPIGQIIFPYMASFFAKDFNRAKLVSKKLIQIINVVILPLILIISFFSKSVLGFLYGEEFMPFYILLIIQLVWCYFSILNNVFGIQLLVASGNEKIYSRVYRLCMYISVLLNLCLTYYFSNLGATLSLMISEIMLSVLLFSKIKGLIGENR